jgi:peptide/nickel transport system permease protein
MTRVVGRSAQGAGWLWRQPGDLIAFGVIATFILLATAAPRVAPHDPLEQHGAHRFQAPSPSYWLGTDEFGRDIFSRIVFGARPSLFTAAGVILLSMCSGVPLGLAGGFFGSWIDACIMRLLDCLLAVPSILLAMAIVTIIGPGIVNVAVAVGVVSLPAFARLTRASTLSLREREFVQAARAVGAGPGYLMFRTILPNALPPLLVQGAIVGANAILLEAALSFLGLGIQPPQPSWGAMLSTGRSFLYQSPWYGLFPGMVITAVVLSLNTVAGTLERAAGGRRVRGPVGIA